MRRLESTERASVARPHHGGALPAHDAKLARRRKVRAGGSLGGDARGLRADCVGAQADGGPAAPSCPRRTSTRFAISTAPR